MFVSGGVPPPHQLRPEGRDFECLRSFCFHQSFFYVVMEAQQGSVMEFTKVEDRFYNRLR